MITDLSRPGAILAYFGGYAPADRSSYELFVLADGEAARLVSLHTGTIPGLRVEKAALRAAQGRAVRGCELRDQPVATETDLGAGTTQQTLDALIRDGIYACHRGLALRHLGNVVGSVRLYSFTLPELRGGVFPAPRLPDQIIAGATTQHPQLWVPGVPLAQLPRRHHRRAAQENHPLWSA